MLTEHKLHNTNYETKQDLITLCNNTMSILKKELDQNF